MRKRKNTRIIISIIFILLLIGAAIPADQLFFRTAKVVLKKDLALKEYGFYLQPVNQEVKINFRHQSPELDPQLRNIQPLIAAMGASVSVVDFDKDGWDDLYFTNSCIGCKNALYRNLGNGSFEEMTSMENIMDVNKTGTGVSMGAVWGDYDNDGYPDLLIHKWGKPELFHNAAGKEFINITNESGLPDWLNANCAVWFDCNNDGLLDLFIGGYFRSEINLWDLKTTKIMPESFRYAFNGGGCYLFENTGKGKFKEVTKEYGLNQRRWVLAAGAADFNDDNYQDLFIANDYGVNELYINEDGKKFVEVGRSAGIGNEPKSGMCVSFGDLNNKGLLGIYNTTITEPGVLIQNNNYWEPVSSETGYPYPKYVNLAQIYGINDAGWSWGTQLADLDNDGNQDLYVTNGFVSGDKDRSYWYDYAKVTSGNKAIIEDARNWPDMKGRNISGYEQDKIWLNKGNGSFEEVFGKICPPSDYDGRAVAIADLQNKGVLDIIVANQNNIPVIYRNEIANQNNWIAFDLQGTVSNADAVGAKAILEWEDKKQVQVVTAGMGFASQNTHRLHFGIGKSRKISKLTIHWPSGKVTTITDLSPNQLHKIIESK